MLTFFWKCLCWSSLKVVSAITSVIGGLRSSTVTSDLVLHWPTCKTTFVRLTQSQAISKSFRVFITFRSMRVTAFFSFFKTLFIQNYRFLHHGDQKISWWRICMWRAVNFEIHLCSSGVISDCIWPSTSIHYVQI